MLAPFKIYNGSFVQSVRYTLFEQSIKTKDAERSGWYLLASSPLLHHITKIKSVGYKAPYETKQRNHSICSTQKKMKKSFDLWSDTGIKYLPPCPGISNTQYWVKIDLGIDNLNSIIYDSQFLWLIPIKFKWLLNLKTSV